METDANQTGKTSTDWLFVIGLILFIPGYLIFAFPTMMSFLALPFWGIGALLIALSRKSWKVKLLIILPTLVLNWYVLRQF